MSEALVPAAAETVVITGRGADVALPALIVDAGPDAVARFLEFFAGRIANARTRAAYGRAVGQFLAWCEARGLGLDTVSPLHVAAYIRTHPGSVPTVKQHLAAIRVLCDWFVVNQVLPVNPAAAVRGPKHVVTKGSTPVLSPAEARQLLDSIDPGTLAGLRDLALLSVMLYSFARVSAVLGMRRQNYFQQGAREWLRLHEKGGKRHDVPAHHRAAEALYAYLEAAGLEDGRAALFQSVDQVGDRLTGRSLTRRVVLAMIKRRAATAGLPPSTCCHTFRATGITAYLSNGGTLEHAQQIAGHASPKTTKLYDRTADTVNRRRDRTHRDLTWTSRPRSDTRLPTKRAILSELTRDELRDNLDFFELEVDDRRVTSQLIDALAGSRKARLDAILPYLSRSRLKELCRAFDLNDSGRRKADLAVRLLGLGAGSKSAGGTGSPSAPSPVIEAPDPPAETLSVAQLEQYLWSAADILRGSIDSSDYKTYIFGLLFLKRLSDRFEEEAEKLIAEGVSEEVAWTDPDEHQFFVPNRARWNAIQKRATNIGEALNKACAALEEQNPALEGVLAGIDYNDERKLGDAKNRDTVLARLVQHFSQVLLRADRMAEPDLLGRAYEYLIEQFADDAGKKGGEFYTPRMVVKLIVELLAPTERMRICDPTAGSGGMLIECAHHIERQGGNPRNLTLHGQEKNLGTWAICKMNMLLHGLPDARIEKGDTIRDPKLVEEGELLLYDRVIANPPFSLNEWGRDVAESDGYGRFRFGMPPKTKGDLAFVQHMVAVLNRSGRLGVVMPHGVLFRGDAEGKIRQGLLQEDLFEAVIGLAPNLFYGTGIPASILVLNRNKPKPRKAKVLFIDASGEFEEGSNQNRLRDRDIEHISKIFHAYCDVEKYARVVPFTEIDALLAQGVDAARDLRRFRFFTTGLRLAGRGEKIHEMVCRCGGRVPIREVCRARSTTATIRTDLGVSGTLGTCGASNASNETRRS